MWHTILDHDFPTNTGYIVKDEARHKYGRIVVYKRRLSARGRWERHVFLIIQCKRVKYQNKLDEIDPGWIPAATIFAHRPREEESRPAKPCVRRRGNRKEDKNLQICRPNPRHFALATNLSAKREGLLEGKKQRYGRGRWESPTMLIFGYGWWFIARCNRLCDLTPDSMPPLFSYPRI